MGESHAEVIHSMSTLHVHRDPNHLLSQSLDAGFFRFKELLIISGEM